MPVYGMKRLTSMKRVRRCSRRMKRRSDGNEVGPEQDADIKAGGLPAGFLPGPHVPALKHNNNRRAEERVPTLKLKQIVTMVSVLCLASSVTVSAQKGTSDEQSCRKFVQTFYDWYLKKCKGGGDYTYILKHRRNVLSQPLLRGLDEDAAAAAKSPHEIVGLEFDPIVYGQDFAEKYIAGRVKRRGDRFTVEVFTVWNGKKSEGPSVSPELAKVKGQWVFTNFHYAVDKPNPNDDNLLSVLKGLREERAKESKSHDKKRQ
jgi:hypothetical protein